MRLLAFDFPDDRQVLDSKDQFMYGPAFLVCPVLKLGARSREVYLPEGHRWTDYWSGETYQGGQNVSVEAPLDRIPLFVKSGSIIPYYNSPQKNVNPDELIELYVYTGEDGRFDLYEDDGRTLDYQSGDYSVIPMEWHEKARKLVFGDRTGDFGKNGKKIIVRFVQEGIVKNICYEGTRQEVGLQ